jgi:AcrR family transcriptional regulator
MPQSAPKGTQRRRGNRRGEGDRLRTELLAAASDLVAEHGGADALSLRAVAARVGVAATSVYLHFDDLDALKAALAQQCFIDFAAARDAASAGSSDPAQALLTGCHAYADYALEHPGHYRLMFGKGAPVPAAEGPPTPPGRAALNALAESIRRCQSAGAAEDGPDPAFLALLVWTSLHGQVSLRMDRPQFPWPPLDSMINESVHRLVGLRA